MGVPYKKFFSNSKNILVLFEKHTSFFGGLPAEKTNYSHVVSFYRFFQHGSLQNKNFRGEITAEAWFFIRRCTFLSESYFTS